jgi:hypothetical protein
MQLLRKIRFWYNILPLSLILLAAAARCTAQVNNGALHVLPGTMWVSNPETAVVLDNMDLQYDASPSWLLNNSFRFTGTTNSAIGGNSQPYVYAVSVAKTSPAKLFLATELFVAKRINFQTGLFDLNAQYIALDETALLTNESETSRIYGALAGGVQIFAQLNGPVNANPGNLGLVLTSPTSLGNVTITRGHVPMYVNFTGYSVARYYDVSPAATVDSNTTLRFNYFDAELNGLPEDSLGLWESQDATFSPLGFTARNATLNYVEKHGLAQPGRFTLFTYDTTATAPPPIDSAAPPPADTTNVHVVLFGSWIKDLASLSWVVSPANETDQLIVERKYSNESSFTPITSIPGITTGATTTGVSYAFTDSTVKTGPYDVSYQVNAVDQKGKSVYSNTITLTAISTEGFILNLYPTIAVGGQVYIKAGNMAIDKMQMQVFDSRGGLVMSGTLPYVSQWLSVAPLARGLYRLSLRSASNKFIGTFIK